MSQPPPVALLRLRDNDIVRLCGLEAAGQGLDLLARHLVTRCRRDGARLEATISAPAAATVAWVEIADVPVPAAVRWGCSRDAGGGAPAGAFACAHVAAILSAWVRQLDDFASPAPEPSLPAGPADAGQSAGIPTPAVAAQPARPHPRLDRSLADELRRIPAAELLAAAGRVLGDSGDQEEPARGRLAAALTDPVVLSAVVARLDPAAVRLLWTIALLGGALTASELEDQALRSGRPASVVRADLRSLERHALVFPTMGSPQARGARQLIGWRLPAEVRAGLTLALPLEPASIVRAEGWPTSPTAAPPLATGAAKHGALRLLPADPCRMAAGLALLARAPYPLGPLAPPPRERTPTGGPRPPANTITGVAGDLPPEQLAALARTANLSAGLLRVARRALLWAREREPWHPVLDLSALSPDARAEALHAGFRLWLGAMTPAELADLDLAPEGVRARFDPAHPVYRPSALADDCAGARAFVARLVACARPGTWYEIERLLQLVWEVHPAFLRGRQRAYLAPMWWLETAQGRVLRPSIHEEWLAAEGVLLRQVVAGPLHWWGAVELAVDAADRPRAFRLTPFGASLLGSDRADDDGVLARAGEGTSAVLPTRGGALAVAPLAAGAALLAALEEWARPVAVAGRRLIYVPAPDLAAAAFDRGGAPDELLARLRALGDASGARAAQALAARLEEWRTRHGRSRIAEGLTLVEAADEVALAEALAALPDGARRGRRLGPAALLLAPEDEAALRTALQKHGYEL